MRFVKLLSVLTLFSVVSSPVLGQKWYVSTSGSNSNSGSSAYPLETIQAAIDSSSNGDTIVIKEGTYSENLNLPNHKIIIGSLWLDDGAESHISKTIIDGSGYYGNNPLFNTTNDIFHVIGLTVSGAPKQVFQTWNKNGSSIRKCVIYQCGNNSVWGVVALYGNTLLDSCTFDENYGRYIVSNNGGQAGILQVTSRCTFKNNGVSSQNSGGYASVFSEGRIIIRSCLFYNNNSACIATGGNGGVDSAVIINNTIVNNKSYGITFENWGGGTLNILINNIIQGNKYNIAFNNSGYSVLLMRKNFIYPYLSGSYGYPSKFNFKLTNYGQDTTTALTWNSDFSLPNYSPGLAQGYSSGFLDKDIKGKSQPTPSGTSPDVGAFENASGFPAPYITRGDGGEKQANLTWAQTSFSGLKYFKIYRSTSPISDTATVGVVVDTLWSGRTTFKDSGLTNLTKYYYRMKSINSSGLESGMSNQVEVRPNTPPNAPDSLKVENGPRMVRLSWKASTSGSVKYRIYRGTSANNLQVLVDTTSKLNYVDQGLTAWKPYYYAIRAIDTVGVPSKFTATKIGLPTNIWWVSTTGDDGNTGAPWSALKTIPKGISYAQSSSHDTVYVLAGTYKTNFNLSGKDIAVIGYEGATKTKLEPATASPILQFNNNEPKTSLVQGFTFQNGTEAVWVSPGGEGTVRNCIMTKINNGNAVIVTHYGSVKFENCLIYGNDHYIFNFDYKDTSIGRRNVFINCTVSSDDYYPMMRGHGYGNGVIAFHNCILVNNYTQSSLIGGNHIMVNCLTNDSVYGKQSKNYYETDFAGVFENTIQANYALSNSSKALGLGSSQVYLWGDRTSTAPKVDLNNNPRPNPSGSNPDLGAYENSAAFPSPVIASADGGEKQANLTWSQSSFSGLKYFKIYRSTSPISDTATVGVVVDTLWSGRTTYKDSGLTNLTKYYYRMKSINSSGLESGMSNQVEVRPNTPPNAPDSIKVVNGPHRVQLTWPSSTSSPVKYTVLRTASGQDDYTVSGINTTSYEDTTLKDGVIYSYKVAAVDSVQVRSLYTKEKKGYARNIWFVSSQGKDSVGQGYEFKPTKTIQYAINRSHDGDTVLLEKGTYKENIVYNGHQIVVTSRYSLSENLTDRDSTIIDGDKAGCVVRIKDSEGKGTELSGLVIQNGYSNTGAGIYATANQIKFHSLIVRNNTAAGDIDGGGAYIMWGKIRIENCEFYGNKGRKGGAIALGGNTTDTAWIVNCDFHDNDAWEAGSAFHFVSGNPNKVFVYNTIIHDEDGQSTIWCQNPVVRFVNSTIVNNTPSSTTPVNYMYTGTLEFYNCIIRNPGKTEFGSVVGSNPGTITVQYSNVRGGYSGTGNIDSDPGFAPNSYKLSNASSSIGMGGTKYTVSKDRDGNPRPSPSGSNPDIGAYENSAAFPGPVIVSAEGGEKQANLTWTQSSFSGLKYFKIYRSTSPISDTATVGVVVDTLWSGRTTYKDSGLTNLTKYYYRMKSVNSSGLESGMSNQVEVRPNTPPNAPVMVDVDLSSRNSVFIWKKQTNINKYGIYIKQEGDKGFKKYKEVTDTVYINRDWGKYKNIEVSIRSIDSVSVPSIIDSIFKVRPNGLVFHDDSVFSNIQAGTMKYPYMGWSTIKLGDSIILLKGTYFPIDTIQINRGLPTKIYGYGVLSNNDLLIDSVIIDCSKFSNGSASSLFDDYSPISQTSTVVDFGFFTGIQSNYPKGVNNGTTVFFSSNYDFQFVKTAQKIYKCKFIYMHLYLNGNWNVDSCVFQWEEPKNWNNGGSNMLSINCSDSTVIPIISRNTFKKSGTYVPRSYLDATSVCSINKGIIRNNLFIDNFNVGSLSCVGLNHFDKVYIINNSFINNSYTNLVLGHNGKVKNDTSIYLINNLFVGNDTSILYIAPNYSSNQNIIQIKNNIIRVSDTLWRLTAIGQGFSDYFKLDLKNNDTSNIENELIVINGNLTPKLSSHSVAIGAGFNHKFVNDIDLYGNPRINPKNTNCDIGAFESKWAYPNPEIDSIRTLEDSVFVYIRLKRIPNSNVSFIYEVKDTSSNVKFNDTVVFSNLSTIIRLKLQTGKKYVLRQFGTLLGGDTIVRTFHTMLKPDMYSPSNQSTMVDTAKSLKWWPSPYAQKYRVQLSSTSSFTSTLLDRVVSVDSVKPSGLKLNRTYYWRAMSFDSQGRSLWSNAFSYQTEIQKARIDSLRYSPNVVKVYFSVEDTFNISKFFVYRDTSANAFDLIDSVSVTSRVFIDSFAQPGNRYYYRLKIANNQNVLGNFGQERALNVLIRPTPQSPTDEQDSVEWNRQFVWTKSNKAQQSEFELYRHEDTTTQISKKVLSIDTLSIANLKQNRYHTWRVRSLDSCGRSEWSDTFRFQTEVASTNINSVKSYPAHIDIAWAAADTFNVKDYLVYRDTQSGSLVLLDSVSYLTTTYRDSGLLAGKRYYYQIRVRNRQGSISDPSSMRSASVLEAPELVKPEMAKTNVSRSPMHDWNKVKYATKYRIQVSSDSNFVSIVANSLQTPDSFALSGLKYSSYYYWKVRAEDSTGYGTWSQRFVYQTEVQIPVLTSLSSKGTQVEVKWSLADTTNAGMFVIYRDTAANPTTAIDSVYSWQRNYFDNSSQQDTRYYYRVALKNKQNVFGPKSNQKAINVMIKATIAMPLDKQLNVSVRPLFDWDSARFANKYRIQVSQDPNFGTIAKDTTSNYSSASLATFKTNTNYYWRVRCEDSLGYGLWSDTFMYQTELDVPVLFTLSTTHKAIKLNWKLYDTTNYANLQGFYIYRDTSSDASTLIDSVGKGISTYTDTGVLLATMNYYRIKAYNKQYVKSEYSNEKRAAALHYPTLVSPSDTAKKIPLATSLKWTKERYATKYRIQASYDSAVSSPFFDKTLNDVDSTLISLSRWNYFYYYRVQAQDSLGISRWSDIFEFQSKLYKPTIDTTIAGNKKVRIYWQRSDTQNIKEYKIYRDTTSNNPKYIATVNSVDGKINYSYLDSGLKNFKTYYYWVSAVNNQYVESEKSAVRFNTTFNISPFAHDNKDTLFESVGRLSRVKHYFLQTQAYDKDGWIDSIVWYIDDIRVAQDDSLKYKFRQGTTKVRAVVWDNDQATDTNTFYVSQLTYKKKFRTGIVAGVSVYSENEIYVADTSLNSFNLGEVLRIDTLGNTTFNYLVSDRIRTTPSFDYSGNMFLSNGVNLSSFTNSGSPLFPEMAMGGLSFVTPTVDSVLGRVYVGVSNRKFIAIDVDKGGKIKWDFTADAPMAAPAVVTAGRKLIFPDVSGKLYGFDVTYSYNPKTGDAPKWKWSGSDSIMLAPAIDTLENIIVGTTTGKLLKLEFDSAGNINTKWSKNLGSKVTTSAVLDAYGHIYVGCQNGKLYCVKSSNGDTLWSFASGAPILSTPTLSDQNRIYVANMKGHVYALDTGKNIMWYFLGKEPVQSHLVHVNGATYIPTLGGSLQAIYDAGITNDITTIKGQVTPRGNMLEVPKPIWGTYQGNYRRTGLQDGIFKIIPDKPADQNSVTVYPNPSATEFRLESLFGVRTLEFLDMSGRTVEVRPLGLATQSTIDVRDIRAGVYFLKVNTEKGMVTKRIVITH